MIGMIFILQQQPQQRNYNNNKVDKIESKRRMPQREKKKVTPL